MEDTRTPQESAYDAYKDGSAYATPEPEADEEEEEDPSEAEEAAFDAANQQKVFDAITAAMSDKAESLFIDMLPGRVRNVPIDLAVGMSIGEALERNLTTLGITRDQLFRILEVAVNLVVDEYLITPARRVRLIWDGMN